MGNRHYSTLTWKNRLKIEKMLKEGHKAQEIADALHVHNSTIYREIKRGMTRQITSEAEYVDIYCADTAQRKCEENLAVRGPGLKIGKDRELADFLEGKMLNEHYSPAAALGAIKTEGRIFSVEISEWTLYSYIAKGLFATLTSANLPRRGRTKKKYRKVQEARLPRGASIEERPAEVMDRLEPGDWEMDSVVGTKGCKKRLLVMTERVTRDELLFLMPDGTSESVIRVLNGLERKLGADTFGKVFRTITVDNGSEFADCEGMQKSCLRQGERTRFYYCHPYSSFERGSNENCNLLIRRWLPKGTSFKDLTKKTVREIQDWINRYPREILGFQNAEGLFRDHLESAGLYRALAVL
jgi:IS30 family transposase